MDIRPLREDASGLGRRMLSSSQSIEMDVVGESLSSSSSGAFSSLVSPGSNQSINQRPRDGGRDQKYQTLDVADASGLATTAGNRTDHDNTAEQEAPQIQVKNVHKTYLLGVEGVPALRGVSLSVRRGEFIVILGKSGGGKTSMLNILGTIDKPTKGELYICNHRITANTTDSEFSEIRLNKIGFVFQSFNLIATMTAQENVSLPMILKGQLSKKEMAQRAMALLESVGIGKRRNHLPSQLSGGEQQRVTIARAMANEPEILLLDEPTGDLDTKNSNIVLSLLLQLNRQQGITLIMVTHDQSLKHLAHRALHMVDGKAVRTEVIPQQAREQAEAELLAKLEEADIRRTEAGCWTSLGPSYSSQLVRPHPRPLWT
eukprot:gb/GEZN01007665.1/.p1 GENE.gb/GEZN01007665.1/~~gb/GEZN01007665.1/.p1  ORF type:complete len:374 (-),score=79.20 gb/GEZN01007665.1/:340-1461(-)